MNGAPVISKSGRLTWFDPQSSLHTQSPDQAQAWRDAGRPVRAITDPDEIAMVVDDATIAWA